MADVQSQLQLSTLGTKEKAIDIIADLVVTAGADTTTTTAVVFDKPFVNIPKILGVVCTDDDVIKGSVSATNVTITGMDVNIYQVLSGDVAEDLVLKTMLGSGLLILKSGKPPAELR